MDFLASIGYFVGWFTLALINAAVAHSKKRSWSNWFLMSLFAGPIATMFIVLWPPGDWKRRKARTR